MKASAESLPIIRVSRVKAGTVTKARPPLDVQMFDLAVKLTNNAARLRARLDGVEARVQLLESLLERRGDR